MYLHCKIIPIAYNFAFVFSGYCCRVMCFISKAFKEGEMDHFWIIFDTH